MAPPSHNLPAPAPAVGRGRGSTLSFLLSGVMLVIYFGFITLVGYDQPLMGREIVPGLSWGILLGALVIVSAWGLTLLYVLSTNKKGGA